MSTEDGGLEPPHPQTGHDQTIPDDETPDTVPPPPPEDSHGFLEQFETLTHASFETLKGVVESGLQVTERVMLMNVALKLFAYAVHNAKSEDFTDEQKSEIESLVLELETSLHLHS